MNCTPIQEMSERILAWIIRGRERNEVMIGYYLGALIDQYLKCRIDQNYENSYPARAESKRHRRR